MTAKVFVDTNVLVYSRDASEPEKQAQAVSWMAYLWRTRTGRLSYQILQEFYLTVTAKLQSGLDLENARKDIRSLRAWQPIVLNERILENAWLVQDRYQRSDQAKQSMVICISQSIGFVFAGRSCAESRKNGPLSISFGSAYHSS